MRLRKALRSSPSVWKMIPLKLLDRAKVNPNRMDSRIAVRLAKSMDRSDGFGIVVNLVVWPSKLKVGRYVVIGGNQRLEVLRGMEHPPKEVMCCIIPAETPKVRRLLLAEALNTIHGSPDREETKTVIEQIVASQGPSVVDALLGHQASVKRILEQVAESASLDTEELSAGGADSEAPDPSTEVNRIDEPEKHRVIEGRCQLVRWPKDFFDSIVTDPPYKIGVFESTWDSGKLKEFTKSWVPAILPSLKPGGLLGVFVDAAQDFILKSALDECGLILRPSLYWIRYAPKIPGKRIRGTKHVYTTTKYSVEVIVVAQKPPEGTYQENFQKYGVGGFFFQDTTIPYTSDADAAHAKSLGRGYRDRARAGRVSWRGSRPLHGSAVGWYQLEGRRPGNVIVLPEEGSVLPKKFRPYFVIPTLRKRSKESTGHETQKRFDLMRWVVRLLTPPKGKVLDPFAGSGTTLVAAIEDDRFGYGVERQKKWVRVAAKRIRLALKAPREGE